MPVKVITPPTAEPLALTEVKNHLRLYACEEWTEGAEYEVGDLIGGTDGNTYRCIDDHTAAALNQPITGAGYEDFWEEYTDPEDAYLNSLIKITREYAEFTLCHRAFAQQTLEYTTDEFRNVIRLPRPPLIDILEFEYTDAEGGVTPLVEDTDYVVDDRSEPALIMPAFGKGWPTDKLAQVNPVRVRYTAGYASPPEELRSWMLLMIAHYYENREAILPMGHNIMKNPFASDWLLQGYRTFGAGDD